MRLCVDYALVGKELVLKKNVVFEISSGRIESISVEDNRCDLYIPNSVALPPLCLAHSHPLDNALQDYGEDRRLEELVSLRHGLKYQLLENLDDVQLIEATRLFFLDALRNGVLVLGVYAEFGSRGVNIVERAKLQPWIKVYPQPEPSQCEDLDSYVYLAKRYRALGLDTLLLLSDRDLEELGHVVNTYDVDVQVHVSETENLWKARDFEKLRYLRRASVVHGTYLNDEAYRESVYRYCSAWIVCPRSNLYHEARLPSISVLMKHYGGGKPVAVGSDNAAWFSPSPLLEISIAYALYRHEVASLGRRELLQFLLSACTYGCFEALGFGDVFVLRPGKPSVMLILAGQALRLSSNVLVTIVKRGFEMKRLLVVGDKVFDLEALPTILDELMSALRKVGEGSQFLH